MKKDSIISMKTKDTSAIHDLDENIVIVNGYGKAVIKKDSEPAVDLPKNWIIE